MNIEAIQITPRVMALNSARLTVGKDDAKSASVRWWRKILMAEHSPIRMVQYWGSWMLPKWVSTHFVRHKVGVEHFVSTSRPDRTGGASREEKEKSVRHGMMMNAQAIISISRKRLCGLASKETTLEWSLFLENLKEEDPELVKLCVPECVYRGFCPEMKTCGYYATEDARNERKEYLRGYADRRIG